ncbi:uncharacterized protein SEPMUDRAFT_152326 [Sphaerulina musiva SO2202]|uniref:Uncharacterized protein n=1 Tax=Sphaerulina musiva (strain SO2202) TaxID=692275 RepID=M3BPC5_SPHMS|nr:uncharacterized protein SEPMUDRAFT_152326 [Sphaerulina musiva SO2202]EMF08018.1 hypothetical protein SEPMUDRAFT_152326 [Sphaerulina musiva SO2202]
MDRYEGQLHSKSRQYVGTHELCFSSMVCRKCSMLLPCADRKKWKAPEKEVLAHQSAFLTFSRCGWRIHDDSEIRERQCEPDVHIF